MSEIKRFVSAPLITAVAVGAVLVALQATPAAAGELMTSEELIEALKPQGTRGLSPVGTLGPSVALSTIEFDFNSAVLTAGAARQLDNLGAALSSDELSEFSFLMVGHTDGVGSRDYNQSLSGDRAVSARQYLVEKFAIDPIRLSSVGLGEDVLLIEEDPENAHNRRVEIFNMGEEETGQTRGMAAAAPSRRVNAISAAVTMFCLTEGQNPEFFTAQAPTVKQRLVVRRKNRPLQLLETEWPIGANAIDWPADWPPPQAGRYIWSLGYGGTAAFKIVAAGEPAASALDAAATYSRLGCNSQAKAAFQQVIAANQ